MMSKAFLLLLALLMTGCASPSSKPGTVVPSEAHCQKVGEMMEAFATMRDNEVLKSDMLRQIDEMPDSTAEQKATKKVAPDVMNFVLTTLLPAKKGREVGYNKCMAGYFDA